MRMNKKPEYFASGFAQWARFNSFTQAVTWAKELLTKNKREDLVCVYETYQSGIEEVRLPLVDVSRWKGGYHLQPQCLGDLPRD